MQNLYYFVEGLTNYALLLRNIENKLALWYFELKAMATDGGVSILYFRMSAAIYGTQESFSALKMGVCGSEKGPNASSPFRHPATMTGTRGTDKWEICTEFARTA